MFIKLIYLGITKEEIEEIDDSFKIGKIEIKVKGRI